MTHARAPVLVVLVTLASLALCGPRTATPLDAQALAASPRPYTATVPGSVVPFEMVPVPAGDGVTGFWIGQSEVTWAEYDVFRADPEARVQRADEPPAGADALTRPTPPYADETFGFGRQGMPVLSVAYQAAVAYARWLAKRSGLPYRLPTEAEWEHACRAGGGDQAVAAGRAWVRENAEERPHPVRSLRADGLGVFDLVGNLAEWVEDGSDALYPHVARGGSWLDAGASASCAARRASDPSWNERDPQDPQSIWWLTDATFVGFRVIRPFAAE